MSPEKILNSVGIFASLGTLSLAHKMPLVPLFIFGSAIATLAAGIGISGALAGTSSATATALGIAVIEGAISATAATSATGATNALISGSTQGTSTAT